jgi:nitrate reductase gamma subunit
MSFMVSLATIIAVMIFGLLGGVGAFGAALFGVLLPCVALAIFVGGMVYRLLQWSKAPVPFRIPTTCGQQKSLPWIKQAKFDNPSGLFGVLGRMLLEVLCFRSLFRNTRARLLAGGKLVYSTNLWLWAAGMAFHWSMLLILVRHLRFFTSPVPAFVTWLEQLDGFLEVGVPVLYVTTVLFIAAVGFLLL